MRQIIIGSKNQIVIPQEVRRHIAGLKPGRSVSVYVLNKDTVVIKASEASWLKRSYGGMSGAWKNTHPITQLEKMRNEWNEK